MISPSMAARIAQSGPMIPLLVRHEIQVLLRAGHTQADVAERVKASVDTVQRVQREAAVAAIDDAVEHRARRIGRPSATSAFAAKVRGWLSEEPDLPTQELLRRAREVGYVGKKTAFYALVAVARPPRATPIVRFEGLPGEFSQHDFGHVDVRFVDGTKKRVHFFASRLKFSRFAAVTIVDNERVETIVRCLARDFVKFGGLPLMAVFDRPRTIVTKSGVGREVETFNATFAQAIVDMGVGVEMCAPRSGWQKGTVERLVGWVKGSFFKHRKFQDDADLRAQLAAWHVEVNTETPSRATKVIPETRRREELARLRPIKVFPEDLALRIPIYVGPTAEVMFEGVAYSMPPEATLIAGTLFLYENRVRIVAGRFVSEQRRRGPDEPKAPLPEHRAQKLAAVHGRRAKLYEMRQQLLDLGEAAMALLTELVHRDPRRAHRDVEALYALLEVHGDDALRRAIEDTVEAGDRSVDGTRHHLQLSDRGRIGRFVQSGRRAQPSGQPRDQMPLALGRAEPTRGVR